MKNKFETFFVTTKKAVFLSLVLSVSTVSASSSMTPVTVGKRDIVLNLSGQAGGPVDGSKMTSPYGPCVGMISQQPQHAFDFKEHGLYSVSVTSEADLTLIIVGADENLCSDNADKTHNPQVAIPGTGVFKIYVGSKDGKTYPYKIRIENSAG